MHDTVLRREQMAKTLQPPSLRAVMAARRRIAGLVAHTPLLWSGALGAWLKLETVQPTGSFKVRGATNAVLRLTADERARGVATASTGNHGAAVAHAARAAGARAIVCMSALVPANKVAAVEALGAEVRIVGRSQDDAAEEVARLERDEGLVPIPPFDHPDVIAGQGTLGLEIAEDLPEDDAPATVVVPLSGGGLCAGVALALRGLDPRVRVIGVSMERGAAMAAALDAGHPVAVEEVETLADSLGGGIGADNRWTFSLVRDLVHDVVLLTEDEIAEGIRHAYRAERLVLEGAAAVPIAALLAGKLRPSGPLVLVLTGNAIDPDRHLSILRGEAA